MKWTRLTLAASAASFATILASASAHGAPFSYRPPGELVPGSGKGRVDSKVYAPGIRFPIESGPAFANSQVWGHGGSSGPGGSQCDVENFSYPWHDNYCETRSWTMPLCPSGTGHQGQDTRSSDCKPDVHATVAVDDGTITNIGTYSVYLTRADGTRFDYLHMSNVAVKVGQKVKRGDPMGKVSNQFGGTPTTVHLHFNIQQNVSGTGVVYVPPYLSLVQAYETLMGTTSPPDASPEVGDASPKDSGVSDASDAASPEDTRPIGIPDSEEEPLDGAPTNGDVPSEDVSGGCACTTTPSRSTGLPWLASLLPLLAVMCRRRHRGHRGPR